MERPHRGVISNSKCFTKKLTLYKYIPCRRNQYKDNGGTDESFLFIKDDRIGPKFKTGPGFPDTGPNHNALGSGHLFLVIEFRNRGMFCKTAHHSCSWISIFVLLLILYRFVQQNTVQSPVSGIHGLL